jgi:hypothetical protein
MFGRRKRGRGHGAEAPAELREPDPGSPGWEAIDQAVRRIYGTQEETHVGYPPGVAFGRGLQGCSAFWAGDHWHYVSYGLTELFEKEEGSDPEVSGWGYELTIRAPGPATEAPTWPFALLEPLARHTRIEAHPFLVDDRLDFDGPITDTEKKGRATAHDTRLVALAFTRDATLLPIASVNGSVDFRQVVGITADELAEMRASSTEAVLQRLRSTNPLLVTDLSR